MTSPSDALNGNCCPVCGRAIKGERIFCAKHWFQVPLRLRQQIWRLYRTQPGSTAHRRAVLEAIAGFRT